MTQLTSLNALRWAYVNREAEARARHAAGQKVVGYFSANIPEELILAAGAFAVRLSGDPAEATQDGDRYMEDFFDGEIRSLFHRTLTGRFDFADLLVIPRTSEGMLQLYYFLQEVARREPARKIPPLYLFDLLQTNNWLTGRYVRGRMDDFRDNLEACLGVQITGAAISEAIDLVNRTRTLVLQANAMRRRTPPHLSGEDMLCIMHAFWSMDKREYAQHLQNILTQTPLTSNPVRVMVKGAPHDNAGFYNLVESCGAIVAADDHAWGERNFAHSPRPDLEPMETLTEHYHLYSPSPRQFPQSRQDAEFLQLVQDAGVEGVIFYLEEYDDTLGWDYPAQKAGLEAKGIPSLYLARQSYRHPDIAGQRAAVTDFVAVLNGRRL